MSDTKNIVAIPSLGIAYRGLLIKHGLVRDQHQTIDTMIDDDVEDRRFRFENSSRSLRGSIRYPEMYQKDEQLILRLWVDCANFSYLEPGECLEDEGRWVAYRFSNRHEMYLRADVGDLTLR